MSTHATTKAVHYMDHITPHDETRPLAIVEGLDHRERWVKLFEVAEWDACCGMQIGATTHYAALRVRYPRKDSANINYPTSDQITPISKNTSCMK